jgi:hypothetical protein
MFLSLQRLLTTRVNCDPLGRITKPLRSRRHRPQWHVVYPLRPNSQLPFYCRPLELFFAIWALMLGALAFHITDVSYPAMDIPLTLFAVSSVAFLFGYALSVLVSKSIRYQPQPMFWIDVDVNRLRTSTSLMLLSIGIIVSANLFIDGLPPLFGLFSFDTATYFAYGRMKQVLFPLLTSVFVNAVFEPSIPRRIGLMLFSFVTLIVYVTRGHLIVSLSQMLIVLSMTSAMRKKNIYILGASITLATLAVATVLANARTPFEVYVDFLQIRQSYREYPPVFLWLTTYISIPISNMSWIIRNYHFVRPSWSFAYSLVPSFWTPNDPNKMLLESCDHIIDGVHTYLSEYYLDLSYAGIAAINVIIGIAAGYISARGISRSLLVAAVFLNCIVLMYFYDAFSALSTIVNVGIQFMVMKYCLSPRPSAPVQQEG